METLIVLIPVLPLIAFLANGLFGRALGRTGGWLAVGCMSGSALISLVLFFGTFWFNAFELPIRITLWQWMATGDLSVPIAFHVDQLTCLMLAFVTFVSALVFLYSMGYMKDDSGFNRFFAYLGLFDFSMLVLVLGDSLPVLFIGWEGVGLCSYLLISYYLKLPGAPDAGRKAFIVNRIGDFGFLVAMFMCFTAFGTLNIQDILHGAEGQAETLRGGFFITAMTLMFFLGCTGKSAQIPLFIWLPDAMAGPTPVSALIHAATMVTAGVYLIVRLSVLFALAPVTLLTIAIVAGLTAFVAGTTAITQHDIKKVLAYSTVSQLGFMFLACGVGAFFVGIFHVFTHAFFKACLFLGAGSVIHAAHHKQDLMLLGGLRRKMPITALTFLIACLAIAGAPPLAGFFSKDEILWKTISQGGLLLSGHPGVMLAGGLYVLALITALLTAIYSFRAYYLTFEGKPRMDRDEYEHVRESPWTMHWPLLLLAAGAILVGAVLNPAPFAHWLEHYVDPVLEPAYHTLEGTWAWLAISARAADHHPHPMHNTLIEFGLIVLSIVAFVAGYMIARRVFWKAWPRAAQSLGARLGLLYRISFNRWWVDQLYNATIVPTFHLVGRLSVALDRYLVDGFLHGLGGLAQVGSRVVRYAQTGQVQFYAVAILLGVNLVILILWLM